MAKKNNPAADPAAQHSTSNIVTVGESKPGSAPALVPPEVEEIRQLHDEGCAFYRKMRDNGMRIGEILTKLKPNYEHGEWIPFIEAELPFSDRTAQAYMRLYLHRDELKSAESADLPMYQALRLISKTSKQPEKNITPSRAPIQPPVLKTGEAAPDAEIDQHSQQQENQPLTIDLVDSHDERPEAALAHTEAAIIEENVQPQKEPDPQTATVDIAQPEEETGLRFVDGGRVHGWHSGLIPTEKVEREFRKIESFLTSFPRNEALAQQRVFVAGAGEINRVCGANPTDETLKAIVNALMELRNQVVAHNNYRR